MNAITAPQCDFRVGLDVPRQCEEPPTYRCICERCSSEGSEGTFFACAAHRADVEERHHRIYGPQRAVVWQHPIPAPPRPPCSPSTGPCVYYEPGLISFVADECPEHGRTAQLRRERREILDRIERDQRRVRQLDESLEATEFAYAKPAVGSLEQLLERPYKPPELFICEEVELGGGYHTLWSTGGPETDWSDPYQKSSIFQYRRRIVRVPYPPAGSERELQVALDAARAEAKFWRPECDRIGCGSLADTRIVDIPYCAAHASEVAR